MMKRTTIKVFTTLSVILSFVSTVEANDEFLGDWRIDIGEVGLRQRGLTFEVTIERDGDGFIGYIYNGPVPVSIDGDSVVIDIDWVAGSDSVYMSQLVGSLGGDGTISGEYDHRGQINFNRVPFRNAPFTGVRVPEAAQNRILEDAPPDPVDLTGVWGGARGFGGFSKETYATTTKADQIRANFKDMDAPHIRCAGYGLITVTRFGGTIFPLEIFQSDEQITFLYGGDYIRRVYLDDREYPENRETTDMGFSKGQWKGRTLEIITTHLKPNFLRSGHGNPVSGDAYTREYYYLDEDGYLHRDMWVHDPENYTRPPYMPGVLDKSFAQNVITKTGCDPYSYFRQLDMEGELDEMWRRSEFRR